MSKLGTIGHRLYTGEISYDFIGHRRRWYILSAVLITLSILAILILFIFLRNVVSTLIITISIPITIIATFALLRGRQPGGMGLPLPSSPAPRISLAATADSVESGFRALSGRWLRPDGGYILDIRDVDARGKIDAVYLNPRPITVARAEATRDGSTLNVFVELRAPGYPGSTYTLTYDPQRDQLAGIYFQATLQQRFDVVFVRMQ